MGTRYHIELYFPIDRIETAFTKLVKHIDKRCTQPFEVPLLDGKTIEIFSSHSFPPKVYRDEFHQTSTWGFSFDTIFLFPVDSFIQEHIDENDKYAEDHQLAFRSKDRLVTKDDEQYFPVGNLGVSVSYSKKYGRISIGAVAGSQNRMLRYSPSIHRTMLNILNAARGIAGLIYVEDYDFFVLTDTTRTVRIDFELFKDGNDIDGIAEAIIAQLESLNAAD